MDDKKIIELFLARDENAIRAVEKKYGRLCYYVASNILACHEDCEECANDVFLALWNAIPPEIPENLRAYIAKAARNRALAILRDSNARGRGEVKIVGDECLFFVDDGTDLLSEFEAKRMGKLISDFLRRTEEEQREYVNKILFNTKRLSTLVGNILILSKIDNQGIPDSHTKYRLDEQIRQSLLMFENQWSEKNLELDVDMEDVEYNGYENLMQHVWTNLIGNGIKFNKTNGYLRIKLYRQGNSLVFTVEDSGEGISDEALRHIFDKFYQGDTSHKQEGNGLGLALVKKIVTLSGGTISAENAEVGGCRFTVTLPE
jgi:signal transduction histidine kinase